MTNNTTQQTQLTSPFMQCVLRAWYDGRPGIKALRMEGLTAEDFEPDPAARKFYEALLHYTKAHADMPTEQTLLGAYGVAVLPCPQEPLTFWTVTVRKITRQLILQRAVREADQKAAQGEVDEAEGVLGEARRVLRDKTSPALRPQPLWTHRAEVVRRYERAKRGEMGVPFPWPTLNRYTRGAWPEDLILFVARTGVGKCLAHDATIYDGDTGVPMTAAAAFHRRIPRVGSWSVRDGVQIERVAAWKDSSVKPTIKIALASGRELRVTPEHKVLTPNGWVEASTLSEGWTLAVPAKAPAPRLAEECPELLALLVAYSMWARSPWEVSGMESLRRNHGEVYAKVESGFGGKGAGDVAASAAAYFRAYGAPTGVGKGRAFPACTFGFAERSLAQVLGYLWALGGTVYPPTEGRSGYVVYASTSARIAEELQHLLLRLGMQSQRRTKAPASGKAPLHRVHVRALSWDVFRALLGPYLRADQRQALEALCAKTRPHSVYGNPLDTTGDLVAEMRRVWDNLDPAQKREVGKAVGVHAPQYCGLGDLFAPSGGYRTVIKGEGLRALVGQVPEDGVAQDRLGWLVRGALVWDEVVSITDAGEAQCYDFTVPETQCFLANDVVIHNSWALIIWAAHALKHDKRVLLVTTELAQETVAARGMGVALKLPYSALRQGTLSAADEQRLYAFEKDAGVEDDPIFVYGGDFNLSLESLEGAIEDTQPDLVLVDGIYLFKSSLARGYKSRTDQVSENFSYMKRLAKHTRLPFGVSTQLNRDAAKAKASGGGAALHHISLTDAAGWDTDMVLALEQDEDQQADGEMELSPLKGRETVKIPKLLLNWKMDFMDFSEVGEVGKGQANDPADDAEDDVLDPTIPF